MKLVLLCFNMTRTKHRNKSWRDITGCLYSRDQEVARTSGHTGDRECRSQHEAEPTAMGGQYFHIWQRSFSGLNATYKFKHLSCVTSLTILLIITPIFIHINYNDVVGNKPFKLTKVELTWEALQQVSIT